MPLKVLREALPEWSTSYPTRSAQNQGYATHGILVPLNVFATRATQIFKVEPGKLDSALS